jgi:hypothetical protein
MKKVQARTLEPEWVLDSDITDFLDNNFTTIFK